MSARNPIVRELEIVIARTASATLGIKMSRESAERFVDESTNTDDRPHLVEVANRIRQIVREETPIEPDCVRRPTISEQEDARAIRAIDETIERAQLLSPNLCSASHAPRALRVDDPIRTLPLDDVPAWRKPRHTVTLVVLGKVMFSVAGSAKPHVADLALVQLLCERCGAARV